MTERARPSVGKSLVLNSISTYARFAGTFVIGLFIARHVGHADRMGTAGYGLYSLLLSSVGIVAVFESVVRSSLIRELADAYHSDDPQIFGQRFTSSVAATALLGVAIQPVFWATAPLFSLFETDAEFYFQAKWSWIVFGVVTGMRVVAINWRVTFDAIGRVPTGNFYGFLDRVATLVAVGVVFALPVSRDYPVLTFIIGDSCAQVVLFVICGLHLRAACPRARVRRADLRRKEIGTIFHTGKYVVQQQISINLYERTNQLIIGGFLSFAHAAIFGFVALLSGYVRMIGTGLNWGIEPLATRLTAESGTDRGASLGRLVMIMTRLQCAVIFPIVATLYVLARPAVDLWLGDTQNVQFAGANAEIVSLLRIVLLGSPFYIVMEGNYRIMLGAGHVRRYAPKLFVTALIQAVTAVVACWQFRTMQAVAITMASAYVACHALWTPRVVCATFGIPFGRFLARGVVPGAAAAAAVAVALVGYEYAIGTAGLARFAGAAVLAALITAGFGLVFVIPGLRSRK